MVSTHLTKGAPLCLCSLLFHSFSAHFISRFRQWTSMKSFCGTHIYFLPTKSEASRQVEFDLICILPENIFKYSKDTNHSLIAGSLGASFVLLAAQCLSQCNRDLINVDPHLRFEAQSESQAVTQVTEMVSGRQVVKSRQSMKVRKNELAYCGVQNLMGER